MQLIVRRAAARGKMQARHTAHPAPDKYPGQTITSRVRDTRQPLQLYTVDRMSVAILHSRAISGMDAAPVTVEAHLANGLPSFTIVGLPETEVKEAKDRVRAALQTARFDFPARRITINLAPADLPKESGRFDLAI